MAHTEDLTLAKRVAAGDEAALAAFYEAFLGWHIVRQEGPRSGHPDEDGWALLRSPDGTRKLEIQWERHYQRPVWPAVDGEQLMMAHFDLGVADLDEAVAWAVHNGAAVSDHQPQENVRVLVDPEGHPFCLFLDDAADG